MSAVQDLPLAQMRRARREDLPAVRRLLRSARWDFHGVADEDLPGLIERGLGVVAEEGSTTWGFLGVELEPRPATLLPGAPARGQLRALALRAGRWPRESIPELVAAARALLPRDALPVQITAYIQESWMLRALSEAGFELLDQIIFLRLEDLARPAPAAQAAAAPAHLRTGGPADAAALAALDATTFDPVWHFAADDVTEMLMRGRVCVAELDGRIVGYTAMLANSLEEAQLARIGVAAGVQGRGVGRQLLDDAVAFARTQGYRSVLLNTQESNTRSQALYAAAGFQRTRDVIPVLALTVNSAAPA